MRRVVQGLVGAGDGRARNYASGPLLLVNGMRPTPPYQEGPRVGRVPTGANIRRRVGACVAFASLLVAGCSNAVPDIEDEMTETSDSAAANAFMGTPAEHTVLMRACLEENGIETQDLSPADETGYTVGTGGRSPEEFRLIMDGCSAEVGEPPIGGLQEDELQNRYDARVMQFECLVREQLISGEPISFEQFVDDYQRSGQQLLWEPTTEAGGRGNLGPTDICPRDSSTW